MIYFLKMLWLNFEILKVYWSHHFIYQNSWKWTDFCTNMTLSSKWSDKFLCIFYMLYTYIIRIYTQNTFKKHMAIFFSYKALCRVKYTEKNPPELYGHRVKFHQYKYLKIWHGKYLGVRTKILLLLPNIWNTVSDILLDQISFRLWICFRINCS